MSQVDYNSGSSGSGESQGSAAKNPLVMRIAYTIGMAALGWALLWFIFALTVLQLIVTAITGARNQQLAEFGGRLAAWMREIVQYLTAASDRLPFPFAPFPTE